MPMFLGARVCQEQTQLHDLTETALDPSIRMKIRVPGQEGAKAWLGREGNGTVSSECFSSNPALRLTPPVVWCCKGNGPKHMLETGVRKAQAVTWFHRMDVSHLSSDSPVGWHSDGVHFLVNTNKSGRKLCAEVVLRADVFISLRQTPKSEAAPSRGGCV